MRTSARIQLWRCMTHGFMEHTNQEPTYTEHDVFAPTGPPVHRCPISDGRDETCGLKMDGPVTVELTFREPVA